ncbi:hypothetical protein [Ensifer adhaerens]|uniref:hypothetical protein n=1 Tax=Ensifer adhaerens TaxID=106592 RepID=UPI00132F30B3|nr:hypothetical protein [Ensifer adhaerens]QHG70163.1 hypothetical protein DQW09_10030 [Ensifer adhaerens]
MIRATVLATASAIFLMVSGTALSAEAPQATPRRIVRYQYFFCTAVNYIMAELYKRAGDKTSEAARRSKAEKVFEEGKKDLIEVGKDPSEADSRVQEHIDQISNQVEADPQMFRLMDKACVEHFPD